MKKIKNLLVKNAVVPVQWNLAVTEDIEWHNAVIIATAMSRGVDVSKLWDGTILFIDDFPSVKLKQRPYTFKGFSDTVSTKTQTPQPAGFSESFTGFTLGESSYIFGGFQDNSDVKIITNEKEAFAENVTSFTLTGGGLTISSFNDNMEVEK